MDVITQVITPASIVVGSSWIVVARDPKVVYATLTAITILFVIDCIGMILRAHRRKVELITTLRGSLYGSDFHDSNGRNSGAGP